MKQINCPTSNKFYLRALLLGLCLMLSACAAQSGLWLKDNSSQLQVDQDNYACLQESQQPYGYSDGGFGWGPGWGGFNAYSGVQTNQALYSACMKARGYRWQPEKPPQ
jgi:hypothetical protein